MILPVIGGKSDVIDLVDERVLWNSLLTHSNRV